MTGKWNANRYLLVSKDPQDRESPGRNEHGTPATELQIALGCVATNIGDRYLPVSVLATEKKRIQGIVRYLTAELTVLKTVDNLFS